MVRDFLYWQVKQKGEEFEQLIVPIGKCVDVMKLAHEGLFRAHMGTSKTLDRVLTKYFWPGVTGNVKHCVKLCDARRPKLINTQHPVVKSQSSMCLSRESQQILSGQSSQHQRRNICMS